MPQTNPEPHYQINNAIILRSKFRRNSNRAPIDPTEVKLRITKPNGTVVNRSYPADVSKSDKSVYESTITADVAGRWFYRFYCEDTEIVSEESSFYIETNGAT